MKILMTAYPNDVTWAYAVELCSALGQDGVQFTLALMGDALTDPQRAELRTLKNVKFCESTFRAEWQTQVSSELDRAGTWLLDLAIQEDADIVHLNEFAHAALPWRRPSLVTALRGEPPEYLRARAAAGIATAGALVALSRASLEAVQNQCGRAPFAWVVPVGRRTFGPLDAEKELMIATAGTFGRPSHNLAALARVADRLSWPVFALAEAPEVAARDAPVMNMHFLGRLAPADRSAVLARASIFACPAADAGAWFDIVEAAQAGCALVLGDLPELREQWDGHATFVDPDNDDSLHGALSFLMHDADARTDLASRAHRRANAFASERAAAAYLALYIELALRTTGLHTLPM